MDNQKIHIKLKSFDHKLLQKATIEIVIAIERTAADVSGPIPLPRRLQRFTVNRSPHVNKKSREQFEIRRHARLIIISYPTAHTVEALKKIDLPSGVEVQIKLIKPNE